MTDIHARLSELTPAQRKLLALKLKQKAAAADAPAAGGERPSVFPASFAQRRMWLLDRLDPGSTAYSLPKAWRIPGPLDAAALERALDELVRRHEALRTRLEEREGEPVQVVDPPAPFTLEVTDLSALAPDGLAAEVERRARADAAAPFRLDQGPLFRASLLRLGTEEHVLLWNLHHAVTDGWSTGILARELAALYEAFARGEPSPLPPLPLQYGDHALRERERLSGEALERLVGFWRGALESAPTLLELPADRARPVVRTHHGALVDAFLGGGIAARVDALARAHDATPFMVYLAVFQLLLGRYARQDDVLVGTAVANRASADVEGVVGFFVNTLVLRGDLAGDPTFGELLARTRDATLAAFEHQALPFEKLVEELNPERSLSHAPLVQAVMVLHNQQSVSAAPGANGGAAPALRLEAVGEGTEAARFDLSLDLVQRPDGVFARCGYATDLLDEATVRRMLGHFATLLDAAVASPDTPAAALPMMGEEERAALVAAGSATRSFEVARALPALFAEQAARMPGAVALTFGGESVTYAELDARANRIAHRLVKLGARPDTLVGLFVDRSVETVAGILGILKSGAGYLPLDPAYPDDRVGYMLEDSGAPIVVTTAALRGRLPAGTTILCLQCDAAAIAAEPADAPAIDVRPGSLAYVIYTSGSTGKPKGVEVTHANVVRLFQSTDAWFGFGAEDVWTLFHSHAFDFSVWEMWGALLYGGRLVIVPFDVSRLPEEFYALLEAEGVTVLNQTPSAFRQLMRADEEAAQRGEARELALRTVVFGGEALDPATLRGWVERRGDEPPRLVNMYGITETTVHVTYRVIRAEDTVDGSSSPIGIPLPDLSVYLLDRAGQLVPAGVVGEMYVGGAGVARGYLGRPELTSQRFVPDPFSTDPSARLYRSGDLARWTETESAEVRECGSALDSRGNENALPHSRTHALQFMGRADEQVKVRGFRIEPGEIESALLAHASVREAVVMARGEAEARRLVAWVVAEGVDAAELRAHLLGRLPDYMVPAAFVAMDALPLTRHGKVDRRALPDPDAADLSGAGYVEPKTETERRVADIWAAVIGVERVGAHDDFFVLGGHSLLATQVISRVREAFGAELPLRALFEATRLCDFAARVDAAVGGDAAADAPIRASDRNDLPLSFAQERLWFIDRLEPGSTAYNVAMPLRLGGALDVPALERALGEMVRRHAVLRTRFAVADGAPVQRIEEPAEPFRLPVEDVPGLTEDQREVQILAHAAAERSTPFDLEQGPLFRARLFRATDDDHLLLMGMHHAVTDGWSTGIFFRELSALYGAFSRGEASPLPALPVRYADFAAWQREWLRGERLDAQVAWWREHLAGAPAVLTLPTDRPRPPAQSHRGDRIAVSLPADAADGLRALALEQRATPFMALLAAFSLLLSRWSGQDDVVVGTPVAGRTRREVEGLIGLFVNTLPIRTELAGDPSFRALLARVREATLGAYAHQDLPFERLVEELAPERSLSHAPVFQVLLTLQNDPGGPGEGFAGLDARGVGGGQGTAKADLSLMLSETADGRIAGTLEFATDLFDAVTAHRLAEHLHTLVRAALDAPDAPVSTLPLVGDEERAALVAAGSAKGSFEVAEPLHARFAEQAARTPDAFALTFGDASVTYAELDARANRLAHHLVKLGAQPDALVGLCVERSAETVVGILAILKSGAGYLPLDPAYPEDRLAYMLEDSGVRIVVTTSELAERLSVDGPTLVRLDADAEEIAAEPADAPPVAVSPESLAYVIYTSGSTGKPKGVEVTHANVARLFHSTDAWFGFTADDVWTLFHSYAFDFSVWEMWGALLPGGRLVVVPFDVSRLPEEFYALLEREGVTVLNQTPSAFRQLMRADEEAAERGEMRELALRHVIFGGEALDPATLRGWVERRGDESPRLVNMYGITETTVHVTYRVIRAEDTVDGSSSPIGIPLPDLSIHLLDRNGQLVPAGVVGEMYVGGAGVARGYLGRPELTSQRFVPDPFSTDPSARLYRSGDLARWVAPPRHGQDQSIAPSVAGSADSVPPPVGLGGGTGEERARERAHGAALTLEFMGRADEQVKVRGFRIEPGEIESVLLAHASVREAVVLARGENEAKRLVAWLVAEGVDAAELRAHLLGRLPDYMVPAAFVFLDALPLTRHGKVDRRALPDPDAADLSGAGYVAPETETERRVAAIWAAVIGVERVGARDDFFVLGGHSLLATQVISRVRATFGVEVPLRALFEAPRLAGFAARVDAAVRADAGADAPIRASSRNDLPLSFAQERLWFIDRLEPGSTAYNVPMPVRLGGALDASALERALGEMVRRHAVLRTRFALVDGAPVQHIEPAGPFQLEVDDISALPADAREAEIGRLAAAEREAPFDLEAGPLFRVRLVRAADDDHLLLMGMHHAVTDGWSSGIFLRELSALYGAFSRGEASPLPELPVRYADFAAWQREWLRGERLGAQVAWWREHLAGAPAVLTLPTDRPRPAAQSHRGERIGFALPAELAGGLREAALEQHATPFMALLAAFTLVLARWSGQDDVVVGTPVAGRTRRETEGLVGLFVNTLPIRTELAGDPSFRALLGRVREATLGAYAHQDLPFERLVEELAPERSLSHAPVFQVLLALQNDPGGPGEGFAGLDMRGVGGGQGTAKVDLSLVVFETSDGRIAGTLEFATDLFDAATAHRLAEHLHTLARAALDAPDAPVSTLPLVGDEERAALVAAGSATASFPVTATLPARFAEQAARTPTAVAVTFGDEAVTYAELDARANRLAHRLVKLGARPDALVGLCVERSVETVVGILAILKAGAGYLPLDPAYPEDRLAYMLEDSGVQVVVTTSELADRLSVDGPTLVRLDADAEAIAAEPSDAPSIDLSPESLAYVIYTSGSTGRPKGVQVTHANVARLFQSTDAWFGFTAEDVWTLFHSYAFDFSVWELWGALLYGGRLVVVPFEVSRSPEEFYALVAEEGVTILNQTPSAFRQLMRADEVAAERGEMRELALRHVVFGGEALDPATLRGWVERRGDDRPSLVNMYGITETTVHVTYRVIRAADTVDGAASPIGVAIPDLAIHLLDRNGQLVPTGIVGEMYVGGAGVARGYLGRPELTAQRFVPDPFSAMPGARLYRSGDLARWTETESAEVRECGSALDPRGADNALPHSRTHALLFQGRADDQVKVRGFRIELGEIESVLLAHPSVREAVVLARGEAEERRLVAWVVADGASAAELRAHLLAHLPDYMAPSAFVFLDALPLTRHGKVDRRALPEPSAADLSGAGYVAPRTPTEELLAAVWAELLGAERVGVEDGFFELGGHSLLATRVASRVRETLGVELPVRAVFEHATLGALAAEVDRLRRAAQGVETPPIRPVPREGADLPLSFAQERLWFVEKMEAGSATYHMPLFARLEGELHEEALRRALDELVRRHESLRTFFPLVDGLPVQRVAPPAPVELFTHDYAALRDDEREEEAQRLVREHARIPFTLETGPLFRADLARLGEHDHLLLLTLHHVIADGWSLDLLWRELAALYGAFSRGEPSPLAEPPVQYGDFAAWQRAWLRGEVLERQLAYWRNALRGAPPLLRLPTDRPRPAVQTHHAALEAAVLPRGTADAVQALARREGATLFMVLLAALDVVLARLAGEGEVVVGTPIAGRTRAETEGVVGLFLNSLALRVDLSGDPAFRELLRRVRETTLDAYAHQDVPFEAVLEEVHPERTLDRTPVFQVMLNLANFAAEAGGEARGLPGLRMRGVDRGAPLASKFDLTVYAGESPDGVVLQLVYNPDLFDAARMRALLAQLCGVLAQAAADPACPLSALSLAVDEGAAPAGGDRVVRTPAGAASGIGELGQVWARGADGAWHPTGERGRPRADGGVEPARGDDAPAPAAGAAPAPAGPREGEPTATEQAMLAIWRQVLQLDAVGLHDDFFDLGGHSLLGVRLLAQVKKRLKVTLPLTALFSQPTPAGLAAAVDGAGEARDFHHLIPLTDVAAGTLPPLFLTHPAGGTIFRYRDLAAHLGPARPVYALQAAGVSDGREPLRSVDLMAERYLEEVRRVQPHGPYHLAGWSAGGVIAVEIAHRILAAGEEVAFVGLLDSSTPRADAEIPDPVPMYLRLAAGLSGAEGAMLDALGDELAALPTGERLEHLARWLAEHGTESGMGELDGLRPVVEVFRANVAASRRHVLTPYPGRLVLFCAEWGRGEGWEAAGLPDLWRPYAAGELRVEVVPGTHVGMVGEPYVQILAEVIEEVITGVPAVV